MLNAHVADFVSFQAHMYLPSLPVVKLVDSWFDAASGRKEYLIKSLRLFLRKTYPNQQFESD